MTYQKIKETLVDEAQVMTKAKFKRFIMNLSLTMLFIAVDLSLALLSILGMAWVMIAILVLIYAYSTILQYCCEAPEKVKVVSILSKFWIFWAVVLIAEYLVLSYFHFV